MMRDLIVAGAVVAFLGAPVVPVSGQTTPAPGPSLGSVTLPRAVLANGRTLPAGSYEARLSGETPTPAPGQSPDGARYVEFLRDGQVVGRELATVVSAADIEQIAKGRRVAPGTSRVDVLRGDDYLRVWINRAGTHYIIHMPPASS